MTKQVYGYVFQCEITKVVSSLSLSLFFSFFFRCFSHVYMRILVSRRKKKEKKNLSTRAYNDNNRVFTWIKKLVHVIPQKKDLVNLINYKWKKKVHRPAMEAAGYIHCILFSLSLVTGYNASREGIDRSSGFYRHHSWWWYLI